MARHLMAVCVVCLLCAEHLPCHQHLDAEAAAALGSPLIGAGGAHHDGGFSIAAERYVNTLHLPNEQRSFEPLTDDRQRRGRTKRHSHDEHDDDDHHHAAPTRVPRWYVQQLFERFGDNGQTIDVNGFESILKRLNMYDMYDQTKKQCVSSSKLVDLVTTVHSSDAPSLIASPPAKQTNTSQALSAEELDQSKKKLRLNAEDFTAICPILLNRFLGNTSLEQAGCVEEHTIHADITRHAREAPAVFVPENRSLVWTYAMLSILVVSLCGLLAVAVIPCMDTNYYHYLLQFFVALGVGTLTGDALLHLFPHAMMTRAAGADEHIDMTMKGLVAAAGVAFSFLMERGLTMVAEWRKRVDKKEKPSSRVRVMRDPDSVSVSHHHGHNHTHHGHSHQHNHHQQTPQQQLQLQQPQQPVVQPHPCNPHQPAGEKLCKAKYSSYPYCYDEIDTDTRDDHHHHNNREMDGGGAAAAALAAAKASPSLSVSAAGAQKNHSHGVNHNNHKLNNHSTSNNHKTQYKTHEHNDYLDTAQSLLPPAAALGGDRHNHNHHAAVPNISDGYVALQQKHENGGGGGDGFVPPAQAETNTSRMEKVAIDSTVTALAPTTPDLPKENFTIILREHEAKHHGHSHTHGHVHSPPSSLSAVAWMVIMGDGMHNFTDGMAIGAAFSYNIAGGFSTAVAVLCHELPHELGDFAILLKAGMSVRQAIYYNVLSSVLSLIGTVIGIWIGDTPQASAWVFAAAAGMFLYISMVDMMPELSSSSHKEESFAYTQLLLQMIGILLGIGIMLLIALYEHDLKMIFSTVTSDTGMPH